MGAFALPRLALPAPGREDSDIDSALPLTMPPVPFEFNNELTEGGPKADNGVTDPPVPPAELDALTIRGTKGVLWLVAIIDDVLPALVLIEPIEPGKPIPPRPEYDSPMPPAVDPVRSRAAPVVDMDVDRDEARGRPADPDPEPAATR